MPTYHVNGHFNRPERVIKNGVAYLRYTTGSGDDTHRSPCEYGYTRDIRESLITRKQPGGFCNMGGRVWAITTRGRNAEKDETFLEKDEEQNVLDSKIKVPDNIESKHMGNGLLVWAKGPDDLATSVCFVPDNDNISVKE